MNTIKLYKQEPEQDIQNARAIVNLIEWDKVPIIEALACYHEHVATQNDVSIWKHMDGRYYFDPNETSTVTYKNFEIAKYLTLEVTQSGYYKLTMPTW